MFEARSPDLRLPQLPQQPQLIHPFSRLLPLATPTRNSPRVHHADHGVSHPRYASSVEKSGTSSAFLRQPTPARLLERPSEPKVAQVGCRVGPPITGQLTLEGIPVLGLVDTGAFVTCLRFDIWSRFSLDPEGRGLPLERGLLGRLRLPQDTADH